MGSADNTSHIQLDGGNGLGNGCVYLAGTIWGIWFSDRDGFGLKPLRIALKNTVKQATEAAIYSKDNQFRRQYLRLTIEVGIPSHKAKLTVARSMLAALYGMWKKGEEYDREIDKKREKGNKK